MNKECIIVDVGSWNDGYNPNKIISKIRQAIKKKPKEIYITGNWTKWLSAMEEDNNFAFDCLSGTFKGIQFTDDGGNDKIYYIYSANIFYNLQEITKNQEKKLFKLKPSYNNFLDFLISVEGLDLPTTLLKNN